MLFTYSLSHRRQAQGANFPGPQASGLIFPNVADREGYRYPEHGLLRLHGVVPLNEILNPKQVDANGDPAMAVVKNGRTSGMTAGWMSGLKSLVRHYKFINVEFTSRELRVAPYSGARGLLGWRRLGLDHRRAWWPHRRPADRRRRRHHQRYRRHLLHPLL